MKRIGVTGSRGFKNREVIRDWVATLSPDTIIRHGACKNSPDEWVEKEANKRGLVTEPLPAAWDDLSHPDARIRTKNGRKYDANAGLRRNGDVTAAPEVDEVVGFWDGESSGTRDALIKAYRAEKPVMWCDEGGQWHTW